MLLLLRMLVGFSIGGLPVAFTLFTEFCPTSGRGAWLVVLQVVP
jgi:MFS family permease